MEMNEYLISILKWKTFHQVILLIMKISFAMTEDDVKSVVNTNVKFYLYPLVIENITTNFSHHLEMNFENISELKELGFLESRPTVMLIHGYGSNYLSPFPQETKTAYLTTYRNSNVILVDWEKLASTQNLSQRLDPMMYSEAYKHVSVIGKAISDFIELIWAFSTDASYCASNYHLIGLDLGAHAAGVAGWTLQTSKVSGDNPRIKRITGLDPSAVVYQVVRILSYGETLRLDSSDACFVDAIHTDNTFEVFLPNVGHADFYLNGGGGIQPGCFSTKLSQIGLCNHDKSWKYFTKSINGHSKVGCLCSSYLNFFCRNRCAESKIFGQECPPTARGKYFLDITNEDEPANSKNERTSVTVS